MGSQPSRAGPPPSRLHLRPGRSDAQPDGVLTLSSHLPEPESVFLVPLLENKDELVEKMFLVLPLLDESKPLIPAVLLSKLLKCGPGRQKAS